MDDDVYVQTSLLDAFAQFEVPDVVAQITELLVFVSAPLFEVVVQNLDVDLTVTTLP